MQKLREAGRSAMKKINENLNLSQELPLLLRDSIGVSDNKTAFNTKSQPELMQILKEVKTKDNN